MKKAFTARAARFAGCGALLALLAMSSCAGGRKVEAPAVPVLIETVSSETVSALTMEETGERLNQRREEALALLESVLEDSSADDAQRKQAMTEKTRIASRMETEASLQALLAHMGFSENAVIMGEEMLSIVVPWQDAENEQNRVRMIDAAVTQSGFSADAVKIILSKK